MKVQVIDALTAVLAGVDHGAVSGLGDPLLPRAIALNHAGFVTDYDLLSEEEIATNEVYGNFYRKHGIGYRAGTLIPMPIVLLLPA